jgi:hypothetical protein
MNVHLALMALESAGIEGKGSKAARQMLGRDQWPAGVELPTDEGRFEATTEAIGTLAEDLVDGRISVGDLPRRMADIAVLRVGSQPWREVHGRVAEVREYRARALLADDWDRIRKELARRDASAQKQLAAAEKELEAAAKRLDEAEVTSRYRAVRAGGGAAAAWDGRAEAIGKLRDLRGLRTLLADHAGLGERPSPVRIAEGGFFVGAY